MGPLRLTLWRFLVLCTLLGAVVVPHAYQRYQDGHERRELAMPKRVAISHLDATIVAELLRESFPHADANVAVNSQSNGFVVSGPPKQQQKMLELVNVLDQPPIAEDVAFDCFPEMEADPAIVAETLKELLGPTSRPNRYCRFQNMNRHKQPAGCGTITLSYGRLFTLRTCWR